MDENNKALCEALWEQYEPRLRVICEVKLSGLPDEVDDVISEVFTALCERLEKFGPPERPQAWLYGVLNNKINTRLREIYRKRKKEQPLPEDEVDVPFEPTENAIDELTDEIYAAEIRDKLRGLLRDDEYELISEIYYEHMTRRDAALKAGTTESAIKQKHYRIMKKLRKLLRTSKTDGPAVTFSSAETTISVKGGANEDEE